MKVDGSGSGSVWNGYDRESWPAEGIPIVFHEQPTAYEVVPPDRMKEWEALMVDQVKLDAGYAAGYLPTFCYCGPNETNACDSDTIPSALEG